MSIHTVTAFLYVGLGGRPFWNSSIVGPHVDGLILVYRFGRTAREVLRRTHNQLISSNVKILGVVVNDINEAAATKTVDFIKSRGFEATAFAMQGIAEATGTARTR